MMEGEPSEAVDFLQHWDPSGPWAVSAIDPEHRGRIESKVFSSPDVLRSWVEFWNGKRNIYFMVSRPRAGVKRKASKEGVGHIVGFHVDVDPRPVPDGVEGSDWTAQEQARIVEKFGAFTPAPTAIIFSGGGYQGFWKLKAAVEVDDPGVIERTEAVNRFFEKALGGDHCWNVDRVMRLPGTINLPDEKKRAKGRTEVVARLAAATWELAYGFDDFRVAERAETESKKNTAGANGKNGGGNGEEKKEPRLPRRDPPDWTRRIIEHGPDQEGPRSYSGDRSKAVYAVCCALVRAGWTDDEIAVCLLDKANKLSEHVVSQSNPQKYAFRQAGRARESVGSEFDENEDGKILSTQHNIRLALSILEVELSYNAFARRHTISGPDGLPSRPMADEDIISVWLTVDESFRFRPGKEFFFDVMNNEGRAQTYHPVLDYLDALVWDGKPRVDSWLVDYGGAVDSEYVRAVGTLFLVAAVRRLRQPGSKFDEMLVLESKQGMEKSTALATLAVRDEWFTDSLPLDADQREVIEQLSGKWIVEAAELKGMRRGDVEHLKQFLSRQYDRARLSYGRNQTEVPRCCVFCGTTNSDTYLRDGTGNRRYWPVKIDVFDVERLKADRDQLWAEAAAREAAGESIRLAKKLYPVAALEQDRRVIEEPWLGLFEAALADCPTGRILTEDAWAVLGLPSGGARNQEHHARLGDTMKTLGWERKRFNHNSKKAWFYAKGDAEQQRQAIRIERVDGKLTVWYEAEQQPAFDLGEEPVNEVPF